MLSLKKRFPSLQSLGGDGNTSFLRAARAGNLDKVLEHLKNNIDINTSNANGLNALHLASKDGHVNVVSELLKRGAIVDSATKKGNTALHIASLAGQEEVVKLLIQHGSSVNVQSQNGFTPLYMAAQENHDSVVKLLLSNSANQSLATEDGFTPLAVAMQQGHDKVVAVLLESDTRGKVRLPALHIAAKKDDVKAATLLLENDHNPDVTSKSGFTPLHIASHYGNEAIANLLIQKGADVNYAAKHNISPLHVAAKWGKTNMVSLLLEKGANIEAKTRDGLTPLHCAARSGHEQVVDMLLERGAPISAKTKNGLAPLHMAAQGEHVDAARILLYHRAPVDEVTVDYLTALHVAAHCGHVRVAKLLLDRNADANARALNGFTPLHIACKKNRIKVVELLLRHGASISATTESGLTPLHVASFMGCMNIVIYLLQHDASPDVPTVRGETPLHLAARANQTDIIRILLRNGAQVDAHAREQQTPLHIASRLGNVDIVMLLLQHGAQVDATTKDMYTALHIAAKEGQDEVAAVLIENGASLDATTKKGFTPLHLTAKYGHMKVAQLLLQKDAPVDAQGKNGVTPLHVASHYDHQNVALLLLEKGASPHATAKNGHTPLHIAARKNQMDIATTLLEYGAQADAESKAGFTPLHLSSQEGHVDMSSLLLEHKAACDHQARNGLTPLHLCAQEDKVNVAQVLVKNGANIETTTKAGYTPLHVASHFGQANMVRFLLQNSSNVDASTEIGYTPLHQAAQQGHCHIVNLLLEHKANANAQTANGQTPLHIARKLGYISVLDSLKSSTNEDNISPTQIHSDEKYRVVAPEAMHETFMSDSEEEGGEDTVLSDQPYRYLTVDEMKSLGDDSLPIDVTRDERIDSNRMTQSLESNGPVVQEDLISPHHAQVHMTSKTVTDGIYSGNNMDEYRAQHVGRKLQWKNFLVSFLVDARGGAMRGCRHSGVRIIVPARSAGQPTRVTCRYVKPQRTMHPPQLMEGEALASRVLELGPISSKFLGPVVMEVPHFASLRGKEREIVILRSDNGETWREHTIDNSEEIIHDVLNECFEPEEINQLDELGGGRICRFVTYDFPQYFAVVSRIRQEVHAIGPEGGMVSSTVVPQVQAVFPQGALTKKIKVGLQAQPIDPDLTAKLLGRGVAVSPIVTVEPRRRKFHKAITLSMPAPKAHSQGMINQYSGNAPTLRLLCSITGGPSRAQWEDVTGSTPLTFVNDCVSFTTTVSARFWLMDCRNISEATKMATELYREVIHVPFMAKFVVFSKRIEENEARLRIFCMTDDNEDKTLEQQEYFTEVAKSRDVEVLESKPQYIEMAGNLIPVTKSGDQLQLTFKAFRENRLPFNVRVKDQHADTIGRTLFMREPKVAKGEPPQQPICILNIVLPEKIIPEQLTALPDGHITRLDLMNSYSSRYCTSDDQHYAGDMRIVDISNLLGNDWMKLAIELGLTDNDIDTIKAQNQTSTAQQAQSMIRLYKLSKPDDGNLIENGLRRIGREDIIQRCKTGRERISLENEYIETDLMKDSESFEDLIQIENNRLQQMREREEFKYSAEEKAVESSESDDETGKRTVAERRHKIEKRLSIERQIPASTQQKEIVQEITEIKRKSLIEDKKAIHEEEIMLQMPTDNIIKSAIVPEQIIKLKTNKIDTPDVSKTEFDKELHNKFKKTVTIDDQYRDEDDDEDDVGDDVNQASDYIFEETSKIAYDSTVTEKAFKIEKQLSETSEYKFSEETRKLPTYEKVESIIIQEKSSKIHDESRKETNIQERTEEKFESTETKMGATRIQVIDTEDPDLEIKLSKQIEKIEKHESEQIQIEEEYKMIQETRRDRDKEVEPKSYHEKPRESLTEEQFYKSVEASITKKMSEGLIQISDDDMVAITVAKDFPDSQTPPPTPSEVNQQTRQDNEQKHFSKQYDDQNVASFDSVPEQITFTRNDIFDEYRNLMTSEQPKEKDDDDAIAEYIRNEAINLIDGILDESLNIVNAQQHQCINDYVDNNNQINDYNSESENYAITCDINGIDIVKSPTIESLSGKSFDDNMSVFDDTNNILINVPNISEPTTPSPTIPFTSLVSTNNIVTFVDSTITTTTESPIIMTTTNDPSSSIATNNLVNIIENTNLSDSVLLDYNFDNINNQNYNKGNIINNETNQSNIIESSNSFNKDKKRFDRIDKKFERLSSQIDDINEFAGKFDTDFDKICSNDDLNNVQNDFSKISWDESVSLTTTATNTAADVGLSTPDNDLQDLPTESGGKIDSINTDILKPKPTPRLSKTISSDEQILQLADQTTNNEHIISKPNLVTTTDTNSDLILDTTSVHSMTTSITTADVDFKQSKKFWESIESQGSDVSEPKKQPKASNIPVPKPRSKTTPTDSIKANDSISSIKSNSISSENQVEYSESSSGQTSFDEKILKEDDSIISDIRIEDELYPEKLEIEIESKLIEDTTIKPGFYIGESSQNLITRTALDEEYGVNQYDEGQNKKNYMQDSFNETISLESNQTGKELIDVKTHELEFLDDINIITKSKDEDILVDSPTQSILRNIETVDDLAANFTVASLSDTEKEHFESKLFRQGSETRNDILEFEIEGKYTENEGTLTKEIDIQKFSDNTKCDIVQESMQNITIIDQEFIQPKQFLTSDLVDPVKDTVFEKELLESEINNMQKTVEFYNIQYEDQTTPILQEAIEERIPSQIVQVLKTEMLDFSDFEQQEKQDDIPPPQMAEFEEHITHIIDTTLINDTQVEKDVDTLTFEHCSDDDISKKDETDKIFQKAIDIHMSDFEVQEMPMPQETVVEQIPLHISSLIENEEFSKQPEQINKNNFKEEIKFDIQMLEDKNDRAVNNQVKFLEPEQIFQEQIIEQTEILQDNPIGELLTYKQKTIYENDNVSETKTDHKVKFDHKLELNFDKSEIEISEKYSKPAKSDQEYIKKSILTDPSQVDQSMVEKTLEEVQDSLDAVQEELIEVVKDGKLIKQSPSEFEFKILPHHIKYATEPIHESFHEENISTIVPETTTKDKLEWSKTEPIADSTKTEEYTSISSIDESLSKVIHRVKHEAKVDSLNRWSIPDLDNSSSSESHYLSGKTDSRPCSSDLENLLTCGNSSEYQTAMDASLRPGSTEYVTAASTFDHSGKTISSHESMKSLDSESSANLGSIEVSEVSETLVGSIADPDLEQDMPDEEIDFEVDDKYCSVLMEEYDDKPNEEKNISQMKRSQEMIFKHDDVAKLEDSPEQVDNLSKSVEDAGRMFEEAKFSLEDGSILSMSLSSTSAVDTVVENIDDLASSLGASSIAGFEINTLLRDDYTGTSFEEPSKTEKIDSMVMTSSVGQDENTNYANTQITTVTASSIESTETDRKRKGHKRNESNAFGATDFLKGISTGGAESSLEEEEDISIEKESTLDENNKKEQDSQEDELSKNSSKSKSDLEGKEKSREAHEEGQQKSESESDTDPYESEYSRSFRSPTTKKKKNKKTIETFEIEQDHEKRPFTPSQSVSEIIVEDITEEIESIRLAEELARRPSQNMHDYSNIPNITITEDLQKCPDDNDDDLFEDKVLYKVQTQEELNKDNDTPLHYGKEHEFSITDDQFEEMVQRQYEKKLADLTKDVDEQPDSPDSFEMLEQPDISDEFVIIEEVAKEADEFDTEGKGMKIKSVKYVQKHDEEVEKILINSAPADPNQGSLMYRDEMNFEFEESPPSARAKKEQEATEDAATNKKWIEMQLSENAGQMRYPYELAGGVLEDIKEEDAEFEVGSSRISSFKDSFSSTPEYDVLAGRKYFAKEHDDISMSSLQEFESLEQAISLENRKHHQGSQDSLSNGSFTRRYMIRNSNGQGDDISMSSLKEFEGLENACIEAHLIEIKAKEEAALLLSRSDESNKSGNGSDKSSAITSTTITTITTSVGQMGTTTTISQQEIEALIKSKLEECEEDPSNLMEVSTDSLDIALKKSRSTNGHEERKGSELGSSDSLEINRSGDIMTSSIDSFEISKDATARSSRSDVDSLEQQNLQEGRRDSIDSIELEQGIKISNTIKNQTTTERVEKIAGGQKTTTTTTTLIQGPTQIITKTITSVAQPIVTDTQQQQHTIVKNISNDSLNLNQTDPELLLTSTESLDRTSSTATNATYQNENDSFMSSSITSYGSSTMIESLDTSFPSGDFFKSGISQQYSTEDINKTQTTGHTITTTTTTTAATVITKSKEDIDDDVKYEQYDVSDNDFDKTNATKIVTGGEATTPNTKHEEQKK